MEGLGRSALRLVEGRGLKVDRKIGALNSKVIIANGKEIPAPVPCTLEKFLMAQQLLPRSVVVEHNGEAVAPSEFGNRQLQAGDRLEIVKIVAGG